jgi:hypothetical protein
MFIESLVVAFIYITLVGFLVTSLCQVLLLLHGFLTDPRDELNKSRASILLSAKTRLHYAVTKVVSFRHLLGFKQDSAGYINKLVRSAYEPVFKIGILTKDVTIINPELNREIARHSGDISLAAVVASTVGKSVFPLSDAGRQLFKEFDTQVAFHAEFINSNGLQSLLEQSASFISDQMDVLPDQADVNIGEWMTKLVVATAAHAVCGPENPWNMDEEFMKQFL